jgi:predicted RNase H-like nuclease (RuvC/YqgF family)
MFEIFRDQDNEIMNDTFSNVTQKNKKKLMKFKTEEKILSNKFITNEKTVLSLLKNLSGEEKELMIEKNKLLDMEEILKKRIIQEIESKKSRILELQMEIPEVKQRIEFLAKILEIPVLK